MVSGTGASPGIGIGKAFIKKSIKINVQQSKVDDYSVEIARFINAVEKSRQRIKSIYERTLNTVGESKAKIFDAYLSILDDPVFLNETKKRIHQTSCNAEYALKEVMDHYVHMFEQMNDSYLRERSTDIKDVMNGILKDLAGVQDISLMELKEKVIIVADDLVPSDTAKMNRDNVLGIVTAVGGATSHMVILARTLEIPAVTGVENILQSVRDDDFILMDGSTGEVHINPSQDLINEFRNRYVQYDNNKKTYFSYKDRQSMSKDGYRIDIAANIGSLEDMEIALENGAEGIGLFRTEFLFMGRNKLPSEDEQFEAYKTVAVKMNPHPVIVRTIDFGGDKQIPYIEIPHESNPFLGYRAIRLCLDKKELFKAQLQAILRASAFGNLKIMFPMISSMQELATAKTILEEVKANLDEQMIAYNKEIETGIMIEVPSAAILSDLFAKEVDFFSIGTNDLIQYTLAVDRGNEHIRYLYDGYHPAVLRLINLTIQNAHKNGIKAGMCGELASDDSIIPLLLGMGIDELSMNPSAILKSRWLVSHVSRNEWEIEIGKVLSMTSGEEVKAYLKQFNYTRQGEQR